jgi:hypothetical protein
MSRRDGAYSQAHLSQAVRARLRSHRPSGTFPSLPILLVLVLVLWLAVGIEKALIDRTEQLIPLTCMEVEDGNEDEDEND